MIVEIRSGPSDWPLQVAFYAANPKIDLRFKDCAWIWTPQRGWRRA